MIERGDQAFYFMDFMVVYYSVDSRVDLGVEWMGGLYHAAYIVDAVGGILARAVA